jgi:tetratricopeptide (TPR) repeat protein
MTIMLRSPFVTAAWLFPFLALASAQPAAAATCTPPAELSAAVHLHADADTMSSLGNWYANQQQFACAIDAFQSAHRIDPGSAHINYLLGLSYFMAGRTSEAIPPLEESVRSDPSVARAHLILASAYVKLANPRAAEAQWEAALKLDPGSAMAQHGLCRALIAQGQSEPVVALLSGAHLDESLTADLVQALEMENRLKEAVDVLNHALRLYPASNELVYAMVTVQVRLQHPEEGARIAEAHANAFPHDFEAQKLYLHTLEFNADPKIARPVAYRMLAAAPHDPEILYLTGMDDCLSGEYALARSHLQEALTLAPARYGNSFNLRYYLGTALFETNDYHDAIQQLQQAIAAPPGDRLDLRSQARFELAMALRDSGDAASARVQMKLFQDEKQASEARTLAAQRAATAADEMARGEPQKAVDRYREALAATPNDANLDYKLALALDSTGDLGAEQSALEQAVAADPTFALAQYQLGYVESQKGDLPGAEQQFRNAAGAAPGYTKAWISLAATLGMESKFTEAQAAIARALQLAPKDPDALELHRELSASAIHH